MLISYTDALSRLLRHARTLEPERAAVAAAIGRILANDLHSPMALPSFDHAAMDGYALNSGQALADSEHDVHGEFAAGSEITSANVGGACAIMTGAQIPTGLDTVVPVERTRMLECAIDGRVRRFRLLNDVVAGQNIRRAGEDVVQGALILREGVQIFAPQAMLLAALGIGAIDVVRRPRVAVIATGKELVADPRQPLAASQIYSSNAPYLVAALRQAGADVIASEVCHDDAAAYGAMLQRAIAAGADLILTTGAVSKGLYDFVPDALSSMGAELLFHQVAMRPGKPLLAAQLREGPLVLALPGTPMAVAVGMRFFAAPLLRAMQSLEQEPVLSAVLDTPQQPKPGLRYFLRAQFHFDGACRLHASVTPLHHPFRIAPFAASDGWIILPEDAIGGAGSIVEIVPLEYGTGLTFQQSAKEISA